MEKDIYLKMSALSAQHVLERLESRGAHLNLLLLDACRNKPSPIARSARCAPTGFSKMEAPAGSVIAFACAPGKTAGDGSGRNGIFTAHLLKHIKTPGVDVDRMLRAVAHGVHEETRGAQDPYHNHNLREQTVCLFGTSVSKKLQAVPDADELAAWLASDCKMRPDEVADTVPALHELGAQCVPDLAFLAADATVMAALKLKPLTLLKLRSGVSALGGTAAPAPAVAPVSDDAIVIEAVARFEKACDFQQLVATMYAHGPKAAVQEAGCRSLATLCEERTDTDSHMKAGGAGAIEAVVAALRAHGANAGVQDAGCGALQNMCADDSNNVKAGGAGAIEAVVAALRAHGANAAVQIAGCGALQNMCADDSNKVKAGGVGAIEALLAALRAHGADAGVQQTGCQALHNIMCSAIPELRVRALTAGAAPVLEAAAAKFKGEAVAAVAKQALSILKR